MTEIIKKFYHKNKTPKEVARVQLVEVTPKQKLFPIRDFLVEIFITQCIFGSVSFFRKWELRLQGGDLSKDWDCLRLSGLPTPSFTFLLLMSDSAAIFKAICI